MAEPTSTITIPSIIDDESTPAARVTARRLRDDLVVVTVHAEIDLANISLLEKELAGYEQEPWLIVDMSRVRFCAVVGARLLHVMAIRSSVAGRRFEVVDNPAIARVLEVTGLADGITRRSSLETEA
jgi:anti-anti-sigma factor